MAPAGVACVERMGLMRNDSVYMYNIDMSSSMCM